MNIQGYARVQLGDIYVESQNVFPASPDHNEAKKKSPQEKFMQDIGFSLMDSRLASVGAAYASTGRWLFTKQEYLRWQDSTSPSSHHEFLWIKGKPGAGKSTLMKHALQYMQGQERQDSTIVSYFFNARGHDLERSTEGMYRSLIYQVFTAFPQRMPNPFPKYSPEWKRNGWPLPMLHDLLSNAILGFDNRQKFVCYIDALDECDEDDIRSALEQMEDLGESARSQGVAFSVCFASRHYPKITIYGSEVIDLDIEVQHQQDIATFVHKRLRGEGTIKDELAKEITRRCSGVFLWASLVVQIINKKRDHGATRSELIKILSTVPSGIKELLGSIMRNHDPALLPTLQWVLFSRRPLTVNELFFAIKTSTCCLELTSLDSTETSDEQKRAFLLHSSRGLVESVSPEESRPWRSIGIYGFNAVGQFIHETVREQLLSGGLTALDPSLSGNVEALSHARLGHCCQTYIAATADVRLYEIPFRNYAIDYMLYHMEMAYRSETLDLASVDAIPQRTWKAIMGRVDGNFNDALDDISLYILIRKRCNQLAAAMLLRQLRVFPPTNTDPVQKTVPAEAGLSVQFVNVNQIFGSKHHSTALLAALQNGNRHLIELLLQCGADPNLAVKPFRTPMSAVFNLPFDGDRLTDVRAIVKILLQHGADPNLRMRSEASLVFPLLMAVHRNDVELIKLFINFGADPNIIIRREPGELGYTPLALAIRQNNAELIGLYLSHGAAINVNVRLMSMHLCLAAAYGSAAVVRQVLEAGANISDRTVWDRTALHEIVLREFSDVRDAVNIARILLDAGVDINAADCEGHTALTLAMSLERKSLVELLIDRGADLDTASLREIGNGLQAPLEGGFTHRSVEPGLPYDRLIVELGSQGDLRRKLEIREGAIVWIETWRPLDAEDDDETPRS